MHLLFYQNFTHANPIKVALNCVKERGGKTKINIGEHNGNNERPFGMWCAFWTPNKTMESENEKIHFWCAQEYSYY